MLLSALLSATGFVGSSALGYRGMCVSVRDLTRQCNWYLIYDNMRNTRELMYRNRRSLDDFLGENPLWYDLYYGLYLKTKRNIKIPGRDAYTFRGEKIRAVDMLNEVAYQCLRIVSDSHPEDCIEDKFLEHPLHNNLLFTEECERDMCFALVYAVLELSGRAEDRNCRVFLDCYREKMIIEVPKEVSKELPDGVGYMNKFVRDAVQYVRDHKKRYTIDLSTGPERVEVLLGKETKWWSDITENFDATKIREIVSRWQARLDRMGILKVIHMAYMKRKDEGHYVKCTNFRQIGKDILEDVYVYEDGECVVDPLLEPVYEWHNKELYLYPLSDLMTGHEEEAEDEDEAQTDAQSGKSLVPATTVPCHNTEDTQLLPPVAKSTAPTHKKGPRRRFLFTKEEDAMKWAQVFMDYLKKHHKSTEEVDTTKGNFITIALLSFIKEWKRTDMLQDVCGPACARFLEHFCKLSTSTAPTYGDFVTAILNRRTRCPELLDDVPEFVRKNR